MEFKDRVAVVTGGGSGIGRATALAFAREGARVAVADVDGERARAVAAEIEAAGGDALAVEVDVSKPDDLARAYRSIDARWGRLDVVFAHAGINGVWAPADELTPDEWDRTIRTNLSGTFYTIHHALPLLKRQGGAIVVTSSVNGTRMFSNAGASAYSASKAGQVALVGMLALELARHRIRVNAVCPGWIDTNVEETTEKRHTEAAEVKVEYPEGSVPLTGGAPGRPEQVASVVLFLASDRASHVTGTPVWVDGGESLLEG